MIVTGKNVYRKDLGSALRIKRYLIVLGGDGNVTADL